MNTITEIVWPKQIIAAENVKNEKALLQEQTLQITLNEPNLAVVQEGGYVVLDYGFELAGRVRVLALKGSTRVRIRLGESVSEACSDLGESTATNDHAVRDWVVTVPNYSDETHFNSGFRYVRIDCLEGEIALKSVVAVYTHYAGEQLGSFVCDNATLNKIFDTSVRTVMLNLQNDMIWDGIKRDRLVWIGDIHPEMMSATHVFGRLKNIETALDFSRKGTPLPQWMNNMPTYSMWWIKILYDYYMLTGTDDFVRESLDYVVQLSKQIDDNISDDGVVHVDLFLDWPTHEQPDEEPGVEALALLAMDAAAALCDAFGVPNQAAVRAVAKLKKYNKVATSAKQAIAMQYLAGYKPNTATLTAGGSAGMSTFMSYFILRAVHETAGGKQALAMLEEYYGGMLKLGATSFWEDFDIEWLKNAAPITRLPKKGEVDVHASYGKYCYVGFRHSLCHGWASGPVTYLYRCILGFEPLSAGCKRVRIKPDLCGLKTVDAKIPVPAGIIEVHAEAGKKPTVKAPAGVEVVFD